MTPFEKEILTSAVFVLKDELNELTDTCAELKEGERNGKNIATARIILPATVFSALVIAHIVMMRVLLNNGEISADEMVAAMRNGTTGECSCANCVAARKEKSAAPMNFTPSPASKLH